MNTKKKLISLILIMVGLLSFATSCSGSNEDGKKTEEDNYYSGRLTADEMNGEHIKLELCRKVAVDADITPLSTYKDGIKLYYTKRAHAANAENYKKFKKNPTIFGRPLNDFLKVLEENSKVKFNQKDTVVYKSSEYNSVSVNTPYTNSDGGRSMLSCFIEFDKKNKPLGESIYFKAGETNLEGKENAMDGITNVQLGNDLLLCTTGMDMPDLPFGTKSEVGDKMLNVISSLKNSDKYTVYHCVTVDESSYELVVNSVYGRYYDNTDDIKPLESEYYAFVFPLTVDGIEWKSEGISNLIINNMMAVETDGAKISEEIEVMNDVLYPLNANPQVIAYDEDGIQELQLSEELEISDVYKDNVEILPLDEVMSVLKDYFSSKAALETYIKSIKLCYTGDFSKDEDGEIKNIAKPYWYIDYSKKMSAGMEDCFAIIDAVTGDIYGN